MDRWERRVQGFLTELSERGETRLEELSRKARQSELWLRVLSLRERAEARKIHLAHRIEGISDKTFRKAGLVTKGEVERLEEEIASLRWRIDGLYEKNPENADGSLLPGDDEPRYRSLA